jgi:hypothetical protein
MSLLVLATIAREAVYRLKAGPVRFRLPLASLAKPQRGAATTSAIMTGVAVLLILPAAMFNRDPLAWACVILCPWAAVGNLQSCNPRRDARRWLVLASGAFGLVVGAGCLAVGLGVFRVGDHFASGSDRAFILLYSVLAFVFGAAAIHESLSGTRVRDGGVEMFGLTRPWSRIVVKDWHEREGGFALRLSIISPRLFGMPYGRDREFNVPVPATERTALEVFLAGHAATAG